MLVGAHVSVSGGIDKAIDRGVALGATAIQTFASSPRSLKYTPYPQSIIDLYLSKKSSSDIRSHMFHGVYLINLAHEDQNYVDACVGALAYYQKLAGTIGGLGTVFHVGSHKGKGFEAVIDKVSHSILQVLEQTPDGVVLMLENAAGHKGTIGQTFDELSAIYNMVLSLGGESRKLGFCIDTQHAFASGYDIREEGGVNDFVRSMDNLLGLENIYAMHINDSATEYNSKRDRHANIGEGNIGEQGISFLLSHFSDSTIPFILEVPGKEKSGPRKQDVDTLIRLADSSK